MVELRSSVPFSNAPREDSSSVAVAFPTESSHSSQTSPPVSPPARPPYQPFRRISLPTSPQNALSFISARQSAANHHRDGKTGRESVASFDSVPEDQHAHTNAVESSSPKAALSPLPASPGQNRVRRQSYQNRRSRERPTTSIGLGDSDEGPIRRAAKRHKIITEFYQTEKAYVNGLDLVYSHFLTPLLESLETATPLLDRTSLTSVFSNFIDIWNLHRSFFKDLTDLLSSDPFPSSSLDTTKSMAQVLLSHFPYLSLYTPFVTAFPHTMAGLLSLCSRPNASYNPAFAEFLKVKESDPKCGRLGLRDWLLTIVQRCPRYLMLLKDLIGCTEDGDPEKQDLEKAMDIVSKITLSLNTSLHTHAQTLSLLQLQRATPNLPFQLIAPGRLLLRRGTLWQREREGEPREREVLLFSDCLIWLVNEETDKEDRRKRWGLGVAGWMAGANASNTSLNASSPEADTHLQPTRPPMIRSRSKSEAELSLFSARQATAATLAPPATAIPPQSKSVIPTSQSPKKILQRRQSSHPSASDQEEKFLFKGRLELVDLEVVAAPSRSRPNSHHFATPVSSSFPEDHPFEILSPAGSFVLFAPSVSDKEDWCLQIREAKQQRLGFLLKGGTAAGAITSDGTKGGGSDDWGKSTLTSSESRKHLRRTLWALPYRIGDPRLAVTHGSGFLSQMMPSVNLDSVAPTSPTTKGRHKPKSKSKDLKGKVTLDSLPVSEKRAPIMHYIPPIWTPDSKVQACQRCGKPFGFSLASGMRRRHHCRLCGRCVCSGKDCGAETFFIQDTSLPALDAEAARACKECYDTIFPLLDSAAAQTISLNDEEEEERQREKEQGTITSLTNFVNFPYYTSWLGSSMPSLLLSSDTPSTSPVAIPPTAPALMRINTQPPSAVRPPLGRPQVRARRSLGPVEESFGGRPRSFNAILEDFSSGSASKRDSRASFASGNQHLDSPREDEEVEDGGDLAEETDKGINLDDETSASVLPRRREDTARRAKRFSLPAVSLQTTNVTARTSAYSAQQVPGHGSSPSHAHAPSHSHQSHLQHYSAFGAMRKSNRFSLVLGSSTFVRPGDGNPGVNGSQGIENGALASGLAAGRLSELLGKTR